MFYFIYVFVIFLLSTVYSSQFQFSSISRLNIFEIENYKYQIDIDKNIKQASSSEPSSLSQNEEDLLHNKNSIKSKNVITLKNIHGQSYDCYLPDNFEEADDYDDGSDVNSVESKKRTNSSDKSQFNFTLIDEKIKKFTQSLKNSNICIFKNMGWWTYELCFGSHALQYHLLANGSILGEQISLGNFTKDFDWLSANESSDLPSSSNFLYHEQYYEMGSICELTQMPRRAVVKILCDENSVNNIEIISEVESCIYEIHVHNLQICNIPNFSKKPSNFDIQCNPVLSENEYKKYQMRLEELEKSQNENDNKILNEDEEELKESIEDTNKILKPKLNEQSGSSINFFNSINGDDNKQENLPFTDLVKIFQTKSQDAKLKQENSENTKISGNQYSIESLNQQLKDEIAKSQNSIKKLQENTKEFEKFIDQVKIEKQLQEETNNEEKIAKTKTQFTNTIENYFKTDDAINQLTQKLNKIIEDLEIEIENRGEEEKSLKEPQILDKELDKIEELDVNIEVNEKKSDEKMDQIIQENEEIQKNINNLNKNSESGSELELKELNDESLFNQFSNEKVKNLEKALSEKLSSSEKLVNKFKTNNFKVKIITLDSMGNSLNEDDLDGGLSSIISSLFEGNNQQKKLKQMKTNYNIVLGRDEAKFEHGSKENMILNEKDEEDESSDLIIY